MCKATVGNLEVRKCGKGLCDDIILEGERANSIASMNLSVHIRDRLSKLGLTGPK
jgi:hypothetical protein